MLIKPIIKRIQKDLNIEKYIINELLKENFESLPENFDFTLNQVDNFTKFLGITIDQFLRQDYSISLIKKRLISPSIAIKDEYLVASGTFMDTIKGVIDFTTIQNGPEARKFILDHLQLNENCIRNNDLMVNSNCLMDLGRTLTDSFNFSKKNIEEMAHTLNMRAKRKHIFSLIKSCKKTSEVAKIICEITNSHYDKNFKYHLEEKNNKFKIVGISNEEIHDTLKKQKICDPLFTYFKANTVALTTVDVFNKKMKLTLVENYYKNGHQIQEFCFDETILQ